jgi:hypothetical protein
VGLSCAVSVRVGLACCRCPLRATQTPYRKALPFGSASPKALSRGPLTGALRSPSGGPPTDGPTATERSHEVAKMSRDEGEDTVGFRRLPTVRIAGEDYFMDVRLREFRTVTPPVRPIESIRFDAERGQRMLGRLTQQATSERGHTRHDADQRS